MILRDKFKKKYELMLKRLLYSLLLLMPSISIAKEGGLDERINEAFMPVATWWENTVLSSVQVAGFNIPIVVMLLVGGATLFTVYFQFPAITKFWLAVSTVRGKYDAIDHHSVEKSEINIVEGDIKGTIKDESREGEVSHFQALATAVSGTVGLGNIAGVAGSSGTKRCGTHNSRSRV